MKPPKDYLSEIQIDDDILFNRNKISVWLSDFIKEVQVDSYNQAIQDSVKSLQNYEMIWGNGTTVPSNQFEREILKLKIK